MTAAVQIGHGTYAAYQRHHRARTEPCAECKAAAAAYQAAYRQRRDNLARHKAGLRAEERAKAALMELYPDVYRTFYRRYRREELSRLDQREDGPAVRALPSLRAVGRG